MRLREMLLVVLALVVSGAIAAILLGVLLVLELAVEYGRSPFESDAPSFVAYASLVASLIAAPLAVIVGAPGYFLLRRMGWLRWWLFGLLGAIAGGAVGMTNVAGPIGVSECTGIGAAGGFVAWHLMTKLCLRQPAHVS